MGIVKVEAVARVNLTQLFKRQYHTLKQQDRHLPLQYLQRLRARKPSGDHAISAKCDTLK